MSEIGKSRPETPTSNRLAAIYETIYSVRLHREFAAYAQGNQVTIQGRFDKRPTQIIKSLSATGLNPEFDKFSKWLTLRIESSPEEIAQVRQMNLPNFLR